MDTRLLAAALRIKAGEVRAVNEDSDQDAEQDEAALRDAATLLRVLANIMDGMPPSKAFGPPGNWGYETEIGRALAAPGIAPQFQRLTPVGAGDGNTYVVG